MMQQPMQPLVLIQWRELAVLISAMCGAVLTLASVIYGTYKLAAKAFGVGVEVHAKPLLKELSTQIETLSTAVNADRTNRDRALGEIALQLETQREDLNRTGVKLDEHDDELEDHNTRITVLERTRAPILINGQSAESDGC